MSATATTPRQRLRWYSPRSIWRSILLRPRVYFAAAIAIAALLLLPRSLSLSVRCASAWCLGGATYLALAWRLMRSCHSDRIRSRAARQDDSGTVILALILLALFSSFAAIFGLITQARTVPVDEKALYLALAAATIFTSWSVMQVAFALHYAHEYYAPHDDAHDDVKASAGGLTFPGDEHPDYWDFLYFAISIGAASQTSDVSIRSKSLRHLVNLHSVVAFFFNTMVLAMMINLAAGLASM
jgi:uncharacterized membrane protein